MVEEEDVGEDNEETRNIVGHGGRCGAGRDCTGRDGAG
jgi:hypothetical protein